MSRQQHHRRTTAELVAAAKAEALQALKTALPKLVANLSDTEWKNLKREEDRRREEAKP